MKTKKAKILPFKIKSTVFSFARCKRIRNRRELSDVESHARRTNKEQAESRRRPGVDCDAPPSIGSSLVPDDPLALIASYEDHVRKTGAKQWGQSAIGLHLILGVSSHWLQETGNPHSPENPRVQQLLAEARDWTERELGGVLAVRYDVDERSSGIVDVVCAPVRTARNSKYFLPSKALEELRLRLGRRKSFEAVQDSWAAHCKNTLDPAIQRGALKQQTQRDHVHADVLRKEMQVLAEREAKVAQSARVVSLAMHRCRRLWERSCRAVLQVLAERERRFEALAKRLLAAKSVLTEELKRIEQESETYQRDVSRLARLLGRVYGLQNKGLALPRILHAKPGRRVEIGESAASPDIA